MLKTQITLIAILIGCMAFVACERTQDVLEDVMMDPPESETMDMMAYKTWMSVDLAAPMMTVEEAAAAMNPAGTGQAHGMGPRTVYFNEDAAMANMAEGDKMYPVGSMIVKEVMDATDNTMVVHVATMTKTDDAMYMDRGGWIYGVGENNLALADSVGCDTCHAKAGQGNDYVFVSLMPSGTSSDGDGTGNGDGATDNGDGATDNGDGA